MINFARRLVRLTSLTFLVALTAGVAAAQSSGTVTINGSVGNAASLRWWSFTNNNASSGANAPNTQNSPLDFTLDLGDVSPNNSNTLVGGTVRVIVRTNAAYTLSAQVTANSGFGAVGNTDGDISLSDIGLGIANLAASGVLVTSNAVSDSSIASPFDDDPGSAAVDGDGIPSFSASLADIASASTAVVTGPRVSRGGSVNSPNNGLLVDTIYAVAPQFFTPTTFSATVTYTLLTP